MPCLEKWIPYDELTIEIELLSSKVRTAEKRLDQLANQEGVYDEALVEKVEGWKGEFHQLCKERWELGLWEGGGEREG